MKDVVYYKLLKPNQTVTAQRYQQLINLNRGLNQKRSIITQRKRKIILLHDNAQPHKKMLAKIVKDILLTLQLEVLSYLSNCAPSNYFD